MFGRVHDYHVLKDRELVAMCFDLVADVVAFRGERQRRERAADRVDRGERIDIFERGLDLLVAGHGHDAVMRLAKHWALAAQVIPVFVGVLGDVGVA